MGDFLDHLLLKAQSGRFEMPLFGPQSVDPKIIFSVLGGITLALSIGIYCTYRYQQWRNFQNQSARLCMRTPSCRSLSMLAMFF